MINKEIAKIFYQIGEYLAMKDIAFKPQAYQKASQIVESLSQDLADIYQKGKLSALKKIPGIGKNLALKIEEYIKTGKISKLEKLKKECPVNLEELSTIEGLGPKTIKILYKDLRIKNINDLEKAAKAHKIRKLFGFGLKTENNILRSINFAKQSQGRFLLGFIEPLAEEIVEQLKSLKEVKKLEIAGSFRRKKETVGDIDILVISLKPKKVIDFFVKMPQVEAIYENGRTKSSVRLKYGFDVDLRVVEPECFGSALQYFTGNKEHNIALRTYAEKKLFLKINEYGIFKKGKRIASKTEEKVYEVLKMDCPAPELRTNMGEIEAAINRKLPKIIGYDEVLGDLHMHTVWSDGNFSIEKMAKEAKKLGRKYIAITDHTGSLKIANGMDEKTILAQIKKIKKINKKIKGIKIFSGAEVNIKQSGKIDVSDKILSKLDWVVASIHSAFKMSKAKMTERIIMAMENPYVRVIGHPSGRIIQQREGYELDWEKIFKAAKRTGTFLEINAYPGRLDLRDIIIQKAVRSGVKLVISTDSHHKDQLKFLKFGIAQARRGWAEKKDIINALSLEKFEKLVNKGKKSYL